MSRRALGTRAGVQWPLSRWFSAARRPLRREVSGGDSPAGDGLPLPGPPATPLSQRHSAGGPDASPASDNPSRVPRTPSSRGWLRCNNANGTGCSVIAGETSNTYTLVNDDVDKVIKFRVLGSNLTGSREADAVSGVIDAIKPDRSTRCLPSPAPRDAARR